MMRVLARLPLSTATAVVHDLLMIPMAWGLAYWLRFNLGVIPEEFRYPAWLALLALIPIQAAVFWFFGLYRGVWRYASVQDLLRILKSVAVGVFVSVVVLFVATRLEGVPRSVPLLYAVLLVMALSGPRLAYRWLKEHRVTLASGQRVLIVGAGAAGEMLVRDMLREGGHFQPVAFVDDKPRRIGQEIHGIPIVGSCDTIPAKAQELAIEVIVLAVPSARVEQRKRLVALCEQTGLPFRTVPELEGLMTGRVAVNQLREVSIEDLLGREPVDLEWDRIRDGLSGRVVLVTGAGGSIGSELCRQLARLKVKTLVLFENSEFNLYRIELELRAAFPDLDLEVCLGDVVDQPFIDQVFSRSRPAIVFHAAAYKHVPMLENQVRQAVRNNVVGTRVVADAADRHGCSEFVMISTDKAVNPANVMGTTKRVAEIYCQNLNMRSDTRFITVRFGNVLGSAGSVVPLFRQQIADGGPVTVTHPDIERFFMTIPEACQLIMQAAVQGQGGEIFVLEMGEPVKIRYLAEQMIRLSGLEPAGDIEITYTGLRPGEKLYEELFHEQEALQATKHRKILLAQPRVLDWDALIGAMEELGDGVQRSNDELLRQELEQLVPENRMRDKGTAGKESIE